MVRQLARFRLPLVIAGHVLLIALANYLAFWLRFDGSIPDRELRSLLLGLPWLLLARVLVFERFRLFEGLWRYTSLWDLRNLIVATGLSSVLFFVVIRFILQIHGYPRSIFVIEAILAIFFLGGIRLLSRTVTEVPRRPDAKRVLVIGAGDAGAMIAREMRSKPYYGSVPVGFVDDDRAKHGLYIHGMRVFGGRDGLPTIVERTRPDEMLIAIPSAPTSVLRDVVASLQPFDLPIKTLPNLTALLTGQVSLTEIRPLAIEDLLERPQVGLDPAEVRAFIQGRRVLVTGAGGSIGSELCRQLATFAPASLIMLDRYENGLYAVEQDIIRLAADFASATVIADVTDADRLETVFREHHPQVVFHAAAHKHVPLMEANPCEAVKNNVMGTRLLAEAAVRHGVAHFILISTDKAVNPSSVMGATKRVAECIIQSLMPKGETVFAAVRFGNVLGSSGSVVPLFRRQIMDGGPVTVTHSEVRRFFMLIPEAVLLVLHAASLARGGEIFVLEMGQPVKVVDMARNLIRLSGSRPGVDVKITFTGLRPGEKLDEELVAADEEVEPSGREKILRVRSATRTEAEGPGLAGLIRQLEALALAGDVAATLKALRALVPTFTPVGPNAVLLETESAAPPKEASPARRVR